MPTGRWDMKAESSPFEWQTSSLPYNVDMKKAFNAISCFSTVLYNVRRYDLMLD